MRPRRRKLCLQGGNRICNLPARRRAKLGRCVVGLVQKPAKPLGSLQLQTQTLSYLIFPRFALRQAEALVAKKLISPLQKLISPLQVGAEFLNLCLVTRFRLRKEFLIELLNVRNPFRNEGV